MLFDDTYNEIASHNFAIYNEKRSRFIAYAYNIYNIEEIKSQIDIIKKKEPGANHYCYAYILHPNKCEYRFSDDGEPNNTAGRQILKEIQKLELTNILIVVVRYFGGIKLGIRGLINSYQTVTELALKNVKILKKNITTKYIIHFPYGETHSVIKLIKDYNLKVVEKSIDMTCQIILLITKKDENKIIDKFKKINNLEIIY